MAALPTPSAVELQQALASNLGQLRSAQAYIVRLRQADEIDYDEIAETLERIDALLLERIDLRARR